MWELLLGGRIIRYFSRTLNYLLLGKITEAMAVVMERMRDYDRGAEARTYQEEIHLEK